MTNESSISNTDNQQIYMRDEAHGIAFRVFVLPKSSKNMISGLYEDSIKIKLTAPPVDGAANKLCIKYLAKMLKIQKSSIEILSGHNGRKKTIMLKCPNVSKIEEEKSNLQKKILSLLDK